MPDLFTHFVTARVPAGFVRDRRLQALFVVGTFLPDFAMKGLYWISLSRDAFNDPTHSILGILLISYLAALFVEPALRRAGWALLSTGGLIHLAVDLVKDSHAGGGRPAPFLPSRFTVELGWINTENVILLIPIDAAILAAWLLWERRRDRVRQ